MSYKKPPKPITPEVISFLSANADCVERIPLPRRKSLHRDYQKIAMEIVAISGTWNPVEIYTASAKDIAREKANLFEAFLQGKTYNPKLSYPHASSLNFSEGHKRLMKVWKDTDKLTVPDRLHEAALQALRFKINDDLATCMLVEGMHKKDEVLVGRALTRKYPGTDHVLMETATKLYQQYTREGDMNLNPEKGLVTQDEYNWLKIKIITPEEQKEGFEFVLNAYGILRTNANRQGYLVVIDENATALDVRDKSEQGPTLFIPTRRATAMTGDRFLPLLAHEIEGHARQSMIGQELFTVGGGPLKLDNEQLYEGYGLRLEDAIKHELFGVKENAPRIYFPFAVRMAEQGHSFADVFSDQVDRHIRINQRIPFEHALPMHDEIAETVLQTAMSQSWNVTYRVMRGHLDMTNAKHFAMAKDLGYLRGWLIDKELQEQGFGYINEAAPIVQDGLEQMAQFDFSESDIPKTLRFKNVTKTYWEKFLKPLYYKGN